MRSLGTSPAVLIAAALALALIAYVFLGGSGGGARAAPHCTSPQALKQVKSELFRRAAAMRGGSASDFGAVANYSVVRASSQLVRRHHRGSSKVTCTGSLTLDLPPGVAVVGGRRSLSARLAYELEPAAGGDARLLQLGEADDIVVPLATVSNAENQTGQLLGALPRDSEQASDAAPPPPVPAPRQPAASEPPPAESRAPAPPPPRRAENPQPARKAPAPPRPKTPPAAKPSAPAPAPTPVASARPSFNCRYAHTAGEIAVCRSGALATLDREMSHQFYRALGVASPGQRAMLKRTRDRFLAYRDRCRSDACIADAYRSRIDEISDIMEGGW